MGRFKDMIKKVAALTGIKDDVLVRGIVNITSDMPVESKLMQFQQRFLYARGNWNYDILDEREYHNSNPLILVFLHGILNC